MELVRIVKKLLKIAAALVVLAIAGIAAILGLLRLEHISQLVLPEPTGPFAVGRAMYDWVDNTRTDNLAPVAGQKRELVVWIWYPAALKTPVQQADYQPALWRTAVANAQGALMSKYFTRDVALVRSHSALDAEVSPAQRTYPVVLMKSGIGALATDYTTLAEDLASHGFFVVGSDSPYSTFVVVFPDGRIAKRTPAGNPPEDLDEPARKRVASELVKVWSADTSFELDQLERLNSADPSGKFRRRLDLASVGVFGHSFGGATAAQFCHEDARCKAGIDMDGQPFGNVIRESLTQPFLYLMSDHSSEKGEDSRQILADIKSICDSDKGGCRIATVQGSRHFNFSDQSLLKDRYLGRLSGMLGPLGERRGLAIAAACLDSFFEIHLKSASAHGLRDLSTEYPEIRFSAIH
jgi:predicted dienelactone hydrolase